MIFRKKSYGGVPAFFKVMWKSYTSDKYQRPIYQWRKRLFPLTDWDSFLDGGSRWYKILWLEIFVEINNG
jgi:hypothetical protein